VILRLNTEIVAALADPEIAKAMRAQGVEPAPTKPEEFERFIKSETLKWARVIKTSGTKLE
jgi:tripartite-type tricarboxylate transporter receptor subunit TctC